MGLGHFSFGTKEACRMRGETSRNLKKSSHFSFKAPYKEMTHKKCIETSEIFWQMVTFWHNAQLMFFLF